MARGVGRVFKKATRSVSGGIDLMRIGVPNLRPGGEGGKGWLGDGLLTSEVPAAPWSPVLR